MGAHYFEVRLMYFLSKMRHLYRLIRASCRSLFKSGAMTAFSVPKLEIEPTRSFQKNSLASSGMSPRSKSDPQHQWTSLMVRPPAAEP